MASSIAYLRRHRASLPKETIGVGEGFDFQLFDQTLLFLRAHGSCWRASSTGWTGLTFREASCGEIRLIYRLTRTDMSEGGDNAASPRLPMTLNLVLKAKPVVRPIATDRRSHVPRSPDRWLGAGEFSRDGTSRSEKLPAKDGPLDLIGPENIDRIETNLQIAHAPKSAVRDFRTDYLLKVFRYDPKARQFRGNADGKPDRPRSYSGRRWPQREFKAWLLDPRHLAEFDRGTVADPGKIPRQRRNCANAGWIRSLGSAAGVWAGARRRRRCNPVFSEADVVAALRKASADG